MKDGISRAEIDLVVPSSKRMRYCGDLVASIGMSMTVPERLIVSLLELGSSIRVPGGYGSLMTGTSPRCRETKRPPSYMIVG